MPIDVGMWLSDVNQNFLEWVRLEYFLAGGGSIVQTLTESDGGGDGLNLHAGLAGPPISSIVITSGANTPANRAGWGLDNLAYTTAAAPLPAAGWAGLGLLGLLALLRRRRES